MFYTIKFSFEMFTYKTSPSPGGVWPASPQPSSETQNQGVDLRKIMEEEDKGKEKSQSR
jgi:hypothetical protein